MTGFTVATIEPFEVHFVDAEGGPAGARDAFRRLEAHLPSLRGRRFYGLYGPNNRYRAGVAVDKEPEALGLPREIVAGGHYARTKIRNWTENVHAIAPTFDRMAEAHPADPTRPSLEYYRSDDELILLLPIR